MTNETKPRANGIVNLTQYAFELVGAVDRLPESPQRDEVLKQAKALRLDLATATRESLFDGFVSLEGLRAKLLAPREIQRDEQGWLTHPELPSATRMYASTGSLKRSASNRHSSAWNPTSMPKATSSTTSAPTPTAAHGRRHHPMAKVGCCSRSTTPKTARTRCLHVQFPQGAPRSHTAYNGADRAHIRRTSRLSGGVRRR